MLTAYMGRFVLQFLLGLRPNAFFPKPIEAQFATHRFSLFCFAYPIVHALFVFAYRYHLIHWRSYPSANLGAGPPLPKKFF